MKNIIYFFKKNVVEKLFTDPFLKNFNWAYSWINSLKFYTVFFYCMTSWGLSKFVQLAFTFCKSFLKNKNSSRTSLPSSFSAWLLKTLLIFYYWPNFIVCLPLLREILGNMCIVIVCQPGCDVINFKIDLIFLIEPLFLHD